MAQTRASRRATTSPRPRPGELSAFAAWRALLQTHAALTRLADAALRERVGIPLGWYDMLVHIDEADDGRIRLHELEKRVFISQSTVSRMATRMECAGLLCRSVPSDDRRSVEVRLTTAGTRQLAKARAVAIDVIRSSFAAELGSTDSRQLLRILSRIEKLTAAQ